MNCKHDSGRLNWSALSVGLAIVVQIGIALGTFYSLKADVAVIREQVSSLRRDVEQHDEEIGKLRDAARAAAKPPAAAKPAA